VSWSASSAVRAISHSCHGVASTVGLVGPTSDGACHDVDVRETIKTPATAWCAAWQVSEIRATNECRTLFDGRVQALRSHQSSRPMPLSTSRKGSPRLRTNELWWTWLVEFTPDRPWWLGYLETGAKSDTWTCIGGPRTLIDALHQDLLVQAHPVQPCGDAKPPGRDRDNETQAETSPRMPQCYREP